MNIRRGDGIGRHEGLKIPWAEMPVPVRVRPGLPNEILKYGIRMDFAVSTCLTD